MTKKIICLVIVLWFIIGCNEEVHEKTEQKIVYKDIMDFKIYIIDSCEYIGPIPYFNNPVLTHKGNCKFCEQRNK